jgi:DNA-binding IscR family transcriptional regulator
MRIDSRLSRVLHVLLHMTRQTGPLSSAQIATMLQTNPTVVRRMMKGLREGGYVRARQGPGGGWTIECDLHTTTLLDLYDALGQPTLFAIGGDPSSHGCAVAQAVDAALGEVLEQARQLIRDQMQAISLADLAGRFDALCTEAGWPTHQA